MSETTLTPQQARIAALNRLKARDKFAAQASSSSSGGGAGHNGNGTGNANGSGNGAGSSRIGGAPPQQQSLVNKTQAGPANSRNAVKGQEAEAPLKRDSSLVRLSIPLYAYTSQRALSLKPNRRALCSAVLMI